MLPGKTDRHIYDVTKIAAEGLCQTVAKQHGLPCISLSVSRFFPEPENNRPRYNFEDVYLINNG